MRADNEATTEMFRRKKSAMSLESEITGALDTP
jgi:hypothetical protein